MPAETHQHREAVDARAILDLLATVIGLAPGDDPCDQALEDLGLDDELAQLHLWDSVVEEFGERALGDFELTEPRPTTLGELAEEFHRALGA